MYKKLKKKRKGAKNKSKKKPREKMEPLDGAAEKDDAPRPFAVGDSIVVKKGVCVPDCEEVDIGGWRGRIYEIDDGFDGGPSLLSIEWDSLTLKNMPRSYIEESEEENLLWSDLNLYDAAVLPDRPRDEKEDVVEAVMEIGEMYGLSRFSNDMDDFDPRDAPTHDYLEGRDLTRFGDLEEIVDFLSDDMKDYFLKWDAVMREEQGRPLSANHTRILAELIHFGGVEDAPILYIDGMARPSEPWCETIRKIAEALVMETFDTSDIHYATATEGWQEIVDCLEEHGKNLTLPDGATSPVDVVPEPIRRRLSLQCCLGELDGLGQKYAPREERVISLEDGDGEARIDSFMDALRDNRESLEYQDLTLEKLYEILVLPPGDEAILTRAMCKELGMSSKKDRIADFM